MAKILEFKKEGENRFRFKENKTLFYIIILVVILLIGTLIYINRGRFSTVMKGKTIYTVGDNTDPYYLNDNGVLAVVTNDALRGITPDGKEKYIAANSYSRPIARSRGDYLLEYDLDGNELCVYKKGTQVVHYTSDKPIKLAKVNKSGYTAVVMAGNGYKEKVIIIDDGGEAIYEWLLSESYIIDIDIAPSCENFAASVVSTETSMAQGTIHFIDIDREEITNSVNRNDSVFPAIQYVSNSYLIAVGESEMIGFDGKGKAKWNVDYRGATLKSYKIADNGHPVLAMEGSRNNTVLKIYNNSGKESGEKEFDEEIKSFDCLDGRIVAATKLEVIVLSYSGREKFIKKATKDIRRVIMLGKSRIVVINADSAESVKL